MLVRASLYPRQDTSVGKKIVCEKNGGGALEGLGKSALGGSTKRRCKATRRIGRQKNKLTRGNPCLDRSLDVKKVTDSKFEESQREANGGGKEGGRREGREYRVRASYDDVS